LGESRTMRGLMIAAPSSGQGKTTVTLGLLRALRERGLAVVSAKSGPDFIDPAFHHAATGAPCATLDPWAADPAQLVSRMPDGGDLLVVEGAMGLFDGARDGRSAMGRGASADLAAALGLPVILVLDVAAQGQTAAAIAAGLARFRADVAVAGAILNRVASPRHAAMVRGAVASVTPVYGALPRAAALAVPSRHLGLVQAGEHPDLERLITGAAGLIAERCDLAALIGAARPVPRPGVPRRLAPLGQRIAVAEDLAFAFAYPHMLADWRAAGAEIRPFSPLADEAPDRTADAVFLPGGYPELHAGRIAAAARFRAGMTAAVDRGATVYGECGGYMVMGRGLVDAGGESHRMLGLLGLETSFARRQRHLGYRRLVALDGAAPWSGPLAAHEFHYATTLKAEGTPLFEARDAAGAALGRIGLCAGRVMGSFAHVIEPVAP